MRLRSDTLVYMSNGKIIRLMNNCIWTAIGSSHFCYIFVCPANASSALALYPQEFIEASLDAHLNDTVFTKKQCWGSTPLGKIFSSEMPEC